MVYQETTGDKVDNSNNLFALSDPLLDGFTHALDLIDSLIVTHLRVCLSSLDEVRNTITDTNVVIADNRVLFLILPDQISNIAGGDGENSIRSSNSGGNGHDTTEQDVAVSGNDAAGHGCDENVDGAGEKTFAAFSGRGEGLQCGDEGVLEVECFGEAFVDVIFGFDGLGVEEDAGALDLFGQADGGCWRGGLAEDTGGDGLGGYLCRLLLFIADRGCDGLRVDGGLVDGGGGGSGRGRRVVDGFARVLQHGVRKIDLRR